MINLTKKINFLFQGEHNSLLGNHGTSNSDVSTHLCEIDDSEFEQESTKSVKWAPSVQSTQV